MSKAAKNWISGLLLLGALIYSGFVRGQTCPAPNMITGANEVCPGSQTTYSVVQDPLSAATYSWTVSGGGQIVGPSNGIQVDIEWQDQNGGPFTVHCTITGLSCQAFFMFDVDVADDYVRYPFNCRGEVNIPLDHNCEKLILPQHLLTTGAPDCPNTYEVSLSINGDIPVPNPVTIAYADQVITATITHPPTGRSCQTLVLLSDATAPELICENDTSICNDLLAWSPFTPLDTFGRGFKTPTVIDNCDNNLVPEPQGYEWIDLFNDPIFSAYIVRNWRATDKFGNVGTCMDTIFLQRIIFDSIVCPPDTVIPCSSQYFDPSDPLTSGVPTFEGHPIYSQKSFCEVGIEYEDRIAYHCAGTYTIYREWILADLEAQVVTYDTCHQVIEIIDTVGPELSFDSTVHELQHPDLVGVNPDSFYKTIYYPTLDYTCLAHGYFPHPTITDSCATTDSVVLDIFWEGGHINVLYGSMNAEHLKFDNLAKGKHIITISLRDGCHNTTIDTLIAVAKDIKAPFIITDRYPVVTLGDLAEVTWIDVDVFDEGSWDNCGYQTLWARRVDWATACGVNLCDSIVSYCADEHDSLYCAVLDQDKHINAVESHYAEGLRWLCEDESMSSKIILGGWWYDLIRKATLECKENPYHIDEERLIELLTNQELQCTDEFTAIANLCKKFGFDFSTEIHTLTSSYLNDSKHSSFDILRQIGGGWSKEIPFCCEDACINGKVTIEILAIDHSGNVSRQWVDVAVEDKSAPQVKVRLPDLNISCYAYNHFYKDSVENGNYSVFGSYEKYNITAYNTPADKTVIKDRLCTDKPGGYGDYYEFVSDTINHGLVIENCELLIEEYQNEYFEHCGEGWIERHFTFSGACQSDKVAVTKAVQRIKIYNDCPLRETDIIWPNKDTTIYGCGYGYVTIETEEPVMKYEDDCRDIGIHHKDEIIDILFNADSICKKIIRRWAVIDWCRQTADFHADWIGDQKYHYYEFEQIIYVKDTLGPTILDCGIDTLCIGSDCHADLNKKITVTDNCTPSAEIEVSWILYKKTKYGYSIVSQGETDRAESDDLEIGGYKLIWRATDGCHITSQCADEFEVVDCVKPSPICLGATTVKLYPVDLNLDGQIDTAVGEIWASDLNVSSFDNCQDQVTDFRIRVKGTGKVDQNGSLLAPDSTMKKLSLGCRDIGTLQVEMWVVDQWGNADFCEVIVDVQQPVDGCKGELGVVRGLVSSMNGGAVSEVKMNLTDQKTLWNAETDDLGQYQFSTYLIYDEAYTLSAEKGGDPIDGISTLDIIKVSKHILKKEEFDTRFELEAADVNRDGRISVLDIINLRKLLLGKIDSLPGANMWDFFNKDMQVKSTFTLDDEYRSLLRFTGVKYGDVTGDAGQADKMSRSSEERFVLAFEDKSFKAGDILEIPVHVEQQITAGGLQLSIAFNQDMVGNIELVQSVFGSENTFWNVKDGLLTIVAHDVKDLKWLEENDHLFTIQMRMERAGTLSGNIGLRNRGLKNEIYDDRDSTLSLVMRPFKTSSFELGQNYPNPFNEETTILVDVSERCLGQIHIYDATGKLIYHSDLELQAGEQAVQVGRSQLGPTGIYLYEIQTPFGKQVKRMILTK